jgi:hypothetical protein
LEFKRDFDFRRAQTVPVLKNRGFANIANAQVQHDGRVSALLQKHFADAPAQQSVDRACPRSAGLPTDRIIRAAGMVAPRRSARSTSANPFARYLPKPCRSRPKLYSKVDQSIL